MNILSATEEWREGYSEVLSGWSNKIPETPDIDDIHTSMLSGTIEYASHRYPGYSRGTFFVSESKNQIEPGGEPGVDYARFDIRNEAIGYTEEMEKLDTIIEYARSQNLKILIGVYGMEIWYTSDFLDYP